MLNEEQARNIEKTICEKYEKLIDDLGSDSFAKLHKVIFNISARASVMALMEYEKLINNNL